VPVQIERDTVNRHDILSSACSPYDYPIRFGITKDDPSWLNNLRHPQPAAESHEDRHVNGP
jgi:uncharacterized protein YcgI (DUF1989 family)